MHVIAPGNWTCYWSLCGVQNISPSHLSLSVWSRMVHNGTGNLEKDLHRASEAKRQQRKERSTTTTTPHTTTTTLPTTHTCMDQGSASEDPQMTRPTDRRTLILVSSDRRWWGVRVFVCIILELWIFHGQWEFFAPNFNWQPWDLIDKLQIVEFHNVPVCSLYKSGCMLKQATRNIQQLLVASEDADLRSRTYREKHRIRK